MLQMKRVSLASLRFWPKNARQHGPENLDAIRSSLARFGQVEPLLVQASTRQVIGGNGRLEVMRSLGWTEGDVCEVDVDDTTAAAIGVALNRSASLGEWNEPVLAEVLKELDTAGAMAGVGFSSDELDELLKKVQDDALGNENVCDPGPGEPPIEPVSRPGDLWLLGAHRLLCGDSTKNEDVERVMAGEKADLVVTSPPYNCGKDYGTHDDSMATKDYLSFVEAVIRRCFYVTRKGRMVAWNVGVSPSSLPFEHASLALAAGLRFVREIVWQKVGVAFPIWNTTIDRPAARNYHPNYQHELIYLFSKGEIEVGERCEVDDDCSSDVWTVHQSQATRDVPGETNGRKDRAAEHGGFKDAVHPAVYPIEIPLRLIRHLSARGEVVFEPFSGAGSTLIAAEKLARYCRAIEIEPAYVDVAVRRWEKATGSAATLNATGKTLFEVAAERGVATDV